MATVKVQIINSYVTSALCMEDSMYFAVSKLTFYFLRVLKNMILFFPKFCKYSSIPISTI